MVKKPKPKPEPADAEYERQMHEDAVVRDRERRETRHPCCWEFLSYPHHPLCRNAEERSPLEQLPGQESLL